MQKEINFLYFTYLENGEVYIIIIYMYVVYCVEQPFKSVKDISTKTLE